MNKETNIKVIINIYNLILYYKYLKINLIHTLL